VQTDGPTAETAPEPWFHRPTWFANTQFFYVDSMIVKHRDEIAVLVIIEALGFRDVHLAIKDVFVVWVEAGAA
jgi:hypothetical protein